MKNTLIMVDDNEELLSSYSLILKNQGFNVVAFANAGKAARYLQENDLSSVLAIISDVMMGPIDGLDFVSFVKSVPALAQVDFYLMTGSKVLDFKKLNHSYNIKKVLQKPFKIKDLVDELKAQKPAA